MGPRPCSHADVVVTPSQSALTAGYHAFTSREIVRAIMGKKQKGAEEVLENVLGCFPAPLVLPGDAIDLEPAYPAQDLDRWANHGVRNHVTGRRKTLYIAAPPQIDPRVDFLHDWATPNTAPAHKPPATRHIVVVDEIARYLRTFFHGLDVTILPFAMTFTPCSPSWPPSVPASTSTPTPPAAEPTRDEIGLSTPQGVVRIRVRQTPSHRPCDASRAVPYPYQLNLEDLTQAALACLPSDAYALLLTTAHDMYESDADDFCCGRAWGAKRVAVMSSAQYEPALDEEHHVDRAHVWPASHCRAFVDGHRSAARKNLERSTRRRQPALAHEARLPASGSMRTLKRALHVHQRHFDSSPWSPSDLTSIHMFRLCRTASHELGHCLGLDHCMYRACVMQASAGVAEDVRQPPYLCPVCEKKVAWAILTGSGGGRLSGRPATSAGWSATYQEWRLERYRVMQEDCESRGRAFSPLATWYQEVRRVIVGGAVDP